VQRTSPGYAWFVEGDLVFDRAPAPASSDEGADPNMVETGVPGLVVARSSSTAPWRLVHRPSGLLVSRSITHEDPGVLVELAGRLGPLADWSRREIPVPGPALRHAVEQAARESGVSLAPEVTAPGLSAEERLARAERDRELLRRVLRRVHTAVPPGTLASAIADLDPEERDRLRAMLTDGSTAAGSVVKPLAPPRSARGEAPEDGSRPSRSSSSPTRRAPGSPHPGSAAG